MSNQVRTEVRIDASAVDGFLNAENGPLGQWLARKGLQMQNAARQKANVDTGLMRSRVEFRLEVIDGRLAGVLAAKTSYAQYVHRYNPFLLDAVREVL